MTIRLIGIFTLFFFVSSILSVPSLSYAQDSGTKPRVVMAGEFYKKFGDKAVEQLAWEAGKLALSETCGVSVSGKGFEERGRRSTEGMVTTLVGMCLVIGGFIARATPAGRIASLVGAVISLLGATISASAFGIRTEVKIEIAIPDSESGEPSVVMVIKELRPDDVPSFLNGFRDSVISFTLAQAVDISASTRDLDRTRQSIEESDILLESYLQVVKSEARQPHFAVEQLRKGFQFLLAHIRLYNFSDLTHALSWGYPQFDRENLMLLLQGIYFRSELVEFQREAGQAEIPVSHLDQIAEALDQLTPEERSFGPLARLSSEMDHLRELATSPSEMKAELDRLLSGWPVIPVPPAPKVSPPIPSRPESTSSEAISA